MVDVVESAPSRPAIEARGVTKRFGANVAVNDVSFQVNKGEVLGFLGPNGSGKTTTMRLITSYYTPDSGTILVDGLENPGLRRRDQTQDWLPPREQPALRRPACRRVPKLYRQPSRALYERQEVQHRAGGRRDRHRRGLYDPGEPVLQGLPAARRPRQAILHQPDILILDEPTEGLDPNQRVPIRELIVSIGQQRTVILSTHVLPEAESICDRVMIISRGRIVAQGTISDLQGEVKRSSIIELEVEGAGVEDALGELSHVSAIERRLARGARLGFVIAVDGDADLRPVIAALASTRGWKLWELHREETHLEELFYALTAGEQVE